jgi:hypothetical protein
VATATGIVVAFLILVPFIPDSSAFCAKSGRIVDCPIGNFNPPMPYVSTTYFVSGIGIIHNGVACQHPLSTPLGRACLVLVYTPWTCGTTYYNGGATRVYGCNRGSTDL